MCRAGECCITQRCCFLTVKENRRNGGVWDLNDMLYEEYLPPARSIQGRTKRTVLESAFMLEVVQ